jgi:hypothetical protein
MYDFLYLIACFFLMNLVRNLWEWRYLKSGWVIPLVGIGLWFTALSLYLYHLVPLWLFAVMTIFCEPIGGPIGSVLLMIRFGGYGRFASWRLFQLTEQEFAALARACERAKNQEAAQKILKQEFCFRVFDRDESSFYRDSFKPSDRTVTEAHAYLKNGGVADSQIWLNVDNAVGARVSKLQKLSDIRRFNGLYYG